LEVHLFDKRRRIGGRRVKEITLDLLIPEENSSLGIGGWD